MIAFHFGNSVRQLFRMAFAILAFATMAFATASNVQAEEPSESGVTINIDFPGGNVKVTAQTGNSLHVEPDLRGGRPWFYW